jgi:hypothetical protein
MKVYWFGVVLCNSACTLFLGAQKNPSCNDGIRDPGELCFQVQISSLQGGSEYPTIGDFNGDGLQDVAVGNSLGQVELFFQEKDGAFTVGASATADSQFVNAIVAADFNQDGFTDLATANNNTFSVLLNQNGQNFITTTNPGCLDAAGASACNAVNWIEAKDLDADGDVDLLVVNENFGDPAASLDKGVALWVNDGEGIFSFQENLDFGNNEQSAYGVDLNQDNKVEILTVVGDGNLALIESDGAGDFEPPGQVFQTGSGPKTATVNDFNQDGAPDVVVANNAGALSLFLNPNNGTLDLRPSGNFFIGGGPRTVVSADLEGDGDIDLVVSNDANDIGLSFVTNDGVGNFSPLFTNNSFDKVFGMTTGDLNQDGLPDFVLSANELGDLDEAVLVFLLSAP